MNKTASLLALPSTSLALFAGIALSFSGCSINTEDPQDTATGGNSSTAPQSTAGPGSNGGGSTAPGTNPSGGVDTSGTGNGTGTGTGPAGGGEAVDLGVCNRTATPGIEVNAAIAADTVWSGVVSLTTRVTMSGSSKLTIMPGTTIIAGPDAGLVLGYAGAKNTLIAKGTKEQPIHFCGSTANGGFWEGIDIRENSTTLSELAFVSIEDAGATDSAALRIDAGTKINSVNVKNSAGACVRAREFNPGSDKLSATGCMAPVRLTSQKALTHFPVGGALTGNTKDMVMIDFTDIDEEVTMRKLHVPYLQLNDLSHRGTTTWTIEPGVQYKFSPDSSITAGYAGAKTTLAWSGTADQPIVFSGETESPGSWRGIDLRESTTTNSKLAHIHIKHAGGKERHALHAQAAVALNDITLEDSSLGLKIASPGLAAGSNKVTVNRVASHPIEADAAALLSLPVGGTFDGNVKSSIKVTGSGFSKGGTVPAMPIPYFVSGNLNITNEDLLTISAGAVFEMGSDSRIRFGYAGAKSKVSMIGTQAAPIVFRGAMPNAGYWQHLRFEDSVDSTCKLDFVHISDAGQGDSGLLQLDRAVSVTNSKFSNSDGWGIKHPSGDTTDYKATNTFEKMKSGDVGPK